MWNDDDEQMNRIFSCGLELLYRSQNPFVGAAF